MKSPESPMKEELKQAVELIRGRGVDCIDGVISTGSGQELEHENIETLLEIPYSDIPGMTGDRVYGHNGIFSVVQIKNGTKWAVFTGRKHFYQGDSYFEIGFYVDIAHQLGAKKLLCLNAAGGLDGSLNVGDLVLIEKYRCFIPIPGVKWQHDGGPWRETSESFRNQITKSAELSGIILFSGNYAGVPGPTYETAAEVEWLKKLGCMVVGMSTVPELICGEALSMQTVALSAVANVHNSGRPVTHEEVVESVKDANMMLAEIVAGLV